MSALWLLEAKPFVTDDRTPEAYSVKYWLKPGKVVVVGRPGPTTDVIVHEDKSISRKHAEFKIVPSKQWQQEGDGPYVLLSDSSKYGTWVSPSSVFADNERLGSDPGRVHPNCMVRFGYKSPFKLYHQDWVLYPAQRQAADPAAVAALEEAAAATGLPLRDELPDHPGTRVLSLGAAPLHVDGTILLALLRGYPLVGSNWLLEWQQQKVWRNNRPEEAAYPVQLQYNDAHGRLKPLPGPGALQRGMEQQVLAGRTLLWMPQAQNEALQEAARLLGANNSDAPASGQAAAAAARAAGAVLVRGSEEDAIPAAYRKLPFTTPELLIAGMLEGDVDAAVRLSENTPSAKGKSKGRGRQQAHGTRSTTTSKGRGRGKGKGHKAAVIEEGQQIGSETDASEDMSRLQGTPRVLAVADEGKPQQPAGAAAELAPQKQQQQQDALPPPQQKQQIVSEDEALPAAGAPQHSDCRTAGRKRRHAEDQSVQQQEPQHQSDGEEAAGPAPAKRRRQRQPATGGAAAAAGETQAGPLPGIKPPTKGWHTMSHLTRREQGERGATDRGNASPQSQAFVQARQAASAAKPSTAAAPAPRGRRRGAAAAIAEKAAAVGDETGPEPAGEALVGEVAEDAEVEGEGGTSLVAFMPLVLAHPPLAARGTGRSNGGSGSGEAGVNFKAFRKGGGSGGVAAAVTRTLVAFDAEPYAEDGPLDADTFLKAEAERRRRRQEADELFAANVKARKAAPLPDPDADTPPKGVGGGRGRGRGGKKAASTAASTGQQSMLNFLPTAGRGRGRSGSGRGRGKA